MADGSVIYLHHYEASPYAEKIRAMFGLTGSAWGSVLSPPYPPRPNLQPLVGDFRRIPVAHHGADVFCDTVLISREVAALTGHDELVPTVSDDAARALAARAEGEVFFCAITAAPALPLLGKLIMGNGLAGTLRFVKDRTAMMKGSSLRPPQGKAAAGVLKDFLAALDEHLSNRDCMAGDDISYADFCAYHPLWLALSVGGLKSLRGFANAEAWYARMLDLGEGERHELDPEAAFAEVAASEPRAVPESTIEHDALGRTVSIAPSDYGKDGVDGVLVAVLEDRYVLARNTERCGAIHLHFPRDGYTVTG